MKRSIMAVTLTAALLFTGVISNIYSTTADASTKQKLEDAQDQVQDIENNISNTQGELNEAQSKLTSLLMAQSALAAEIESTESEIADVKVELEEAKAQQEAQYKVMRTRIQYMYENSGNSLLATILDSHSISEILNKVEYMSSVHEYDENLLENYKAITQEVADLETTLETDLAEKEELKASYDVKQGELETLTANLSSEMSDYESQLADAKSIAAQYQQQYEDELAAQKAREEAARKAAQQAAANKNNSSSSGGSSSGGSSSSSSGSSSSEDSSVSYSGSGSSVVAYATQFVGNPYVWAGTSLTNGCDCSGFVMSVYKHFGISLPHSSYSLRSVGTGVSESNIQLGDIICYEGHVGIYAGNGTMVNALNSRYGITYTNIHYKGIVTIRRVI